MMRVLGVIQKINPCSFVHDLCRYALHCSHLRKDEFYTNFDVRIAVSLFLGEKVSIEKK